MRIHPSKRIGIVGLIAAVVMAGTISPARATLTTNVAPLATASASAPLIEGPVSKLNNQNAAANAEVTTSGNGSWQALSWGGDSPIPEPDYCGHA